MDVYKVKYHSWFEGRHYLAAHVYISTCMIVKTAILLINLLYGLLIGCGPRGPHWRRTNFCQGRAMPVFGSRIAPWPLRLETCRRLRIKLRKHHPRTRISQSVSRLRSVPLRHPRMIALQRRLGEKCTHSVSTRLKKQIYMFLTLCLLPPRIFRSSVPKPDHRRVAKQ